MSDVHYSHAEVCRVCERMTDNYGTCVCIAERRWEEAGLTGRPYTPPDHGKDEGEK